MNTKEDIALKNEPLNKLQKAAIKVLLEEHFVKSPNDKDNKQLIFEEVVKELPAVTITVFNKLYREMQHDYYNNLKRIPPEALINKINEQNEDLTERILKSSQKDITDQAKVINELNKTTAQINRLTDIAPKIEINFKTNLPDDYLLNPAVVINTEPIQEEKE